MKFLRLDKKEKEVGQIVFKYFLDKTAKSIEGMEIYSPNDTTTIWVKYVSRQMVNGFSIPDEVEIEIKMPRNNIFIEMTYTRPEVNQPQELYFIIPEGYEDCE
jgi:hypothetical protein